MKKIRDAAANPAGAGTLHASFSRMTAMMRLGELAAELWRAEQAARELHGIYVCKIREFEGLHGPVAGALNPCNPTHIGIISYTTDERQALMAARSKIYAARRRLRTACAKVAREGAASA